MASKKYNVHHLVYYELHQTMDAAILREKQMKKWNRVWKIKLIEEFNPEWNDLYSKIILNGFPPSRE
jgi:putative endonuclease